MADDIAIKVESISKTFILPHEKHSTLKSALINFGRSKRGYEKQQVLNDISFEIKKGEFFGIVGRNGSGKSTLLKLLAGIYTPDKGNIQINGKLTPFIELGVGFNQELSGRENVFLNGALLGFSRKEMEAMYDDIVEFAELERFMDQKLKNYSSGMQVRLAFSIAIRANTEILVLDEVLAVGDANFQKKCMDYFGRVKNANKTVVLVTHDMSAVERFCDRALIIDKGEILLQGKPAKITKKYSDLNVDAQAGSLSKSSKSNERDGLLAVKSHVAVNGRATKIIRAADDNITLMCSIISKIDIPQAAIGVIFSNGAGTPIFATNTKATKETVVIKKDIPLIIKIDVANIFANGEYTISVGIKNFDQTDIYYSNPDQEKFVVGGRAHDFAVASPPYKISIE